MTADATRTVAAIFAVSGLGLLLNIVGVAIPQWSVIYSFHSGIWEAAFTGVAYISAVRAMTILSILAGVGSIGLTVAAFLNIRSDSSFRGMAKGAGALSMSQVFFLSIGVIIYGAKLQSNFGASFYLCIVAVGLYIGAAVLQLKTLASADTK